MCALPVSGSKTLKKPIPRKLHLGVGYKMSPPSKRWPGGEGGAFYRDTVPRPVHMHGSMHTLPCLYPISAHTLQPGHCGSTNKEKVESCPRQFSGKLLGLYCSWLLTVWFLRWQIPHHLIPSSDSHPVPCADEVVWAPCANHLPRAWCPEVTAGLWETLGFSTCP